MTTKEMSDFLNSLWCWARCTEEEQRKLSEIADYLSSQGNENNDCISRERAIERLKLNLPISDGADNSKDRYRYMQSLADIQAIRELPSATPQKPKIKVLDRDEATRKLGTVDIYKASAWVTLLKDLEYLGMKICEVKK